MSDDGRTTFTWGARTDVGRVREVNQDSVHAEDGLYVVADGMGGHRGGEVASAVAIETMVEPDGMPRSIDDLIERVRSAHEAVLHRADEEPSLAGMGTTLCAVGRLDHPDQPGMLGLINVGDSRIYHFAEGELVQLSEDHSLVGDLMRAGHLTPEEAANHPQRNIVTRALGIGDRLLVDYWEVPAIPGDHYLLCSDGLVDEIGDAQIASVLRRLAEPREAVDELVRLALEAGARDNVTVLVVRVDESANPDPDAVEGFAATPSTSEPDVVAAFADTGPLVDDDSPYPSRTRIEDEPLTWRERRRLAAADDDAPDHRTPFRTRGLLALVLALLIVIGGFWVVASYARNNYFVGFEGDQVVVFQGRPGGVLWFDPTFEDAAGLLRSDLTDAQELEVEGNPEFGNLGDAQAYIADLEERVADVEDTGTADG